MPPTLIFGGTFDPVHIGHLRAAFEVIEALGFKRLEWVPSYAPLHKVDQALLPFDLRVAMLRVAVAGLRLSVVSDIEKSLPVPSVTIQTLEAMARKQPEGELYLLLGDREFLRLHKWRRGRDVVNFANIVIVGRTDIEPETFARDLQEAWPEARQVAHPQAALRAFDLLPGRRALLLRTPRIDVSSSMVRERWLAGRSLDFLVPAGVIELLEANRKVVDVTWNAAGNGLERQRTDTKEAFRS